jgi:hypothetical protein
MKNFTILNAAAQLIGSGLQLYRMLTLIKEPSNFMTLVEAHPNMVGAHVMRTMKAPNRYSLK